MGSSVPGWGDAWKEVLVEEPRVLKAEGIGFGDGGGKIDYQRDVILGRSSERG